jgi:hypothetical protein
MKPIIRVAVFLGASGAIANLRNSNHPRQFNRLATGKDHIATA